MQKKIRRKRQILRNRTVILRSARDLFHKKGFYGTTMEDIAQEAELSPGTLYLYFKNKEELYASLSLRILQYLLLRIEHVNAMKGAGPDEKLKALMEAMYDVYEFDPLIIINMFHLQSSDTLRNLTPQLLEEIKELTGKSMGSIVQIFKDGVAKGLFIDRHPVALADSFWSLFSGVILWMTSKKMVDESGGKDHLKETLTLAFEVFGRGIKVK